MIYFKKSMPAPSSLITEKNKASSTNYRLEDVITRIRTDFKNKCYLCEYKAPTTVNVEHFIPHRNDRKLMFKWENLFYACGHCNNLKSDKFDNIIDCTNYSERVEERIYLKMDPYPFKEVEVKELDDDEKTISTVKLLNLIYNGSTPLKTVEAENIRKNLLKEIIEFQKLLVKYSALDEDDDELDSIKLSIHRHLKDSSAFTAFKRWIIKDIPHLRKEFYHLFQSKDTVVG
ncbi:HNH endonuclease [Rossellomorea sp. DUT-2]|uniref:HNH endonuclease n=1 Tax=Rossellomorea sp. DUT-2 TaxID=3412021 RepID=UPI003D163765